MGDANAGNFRYLNHFFEVNQAQSVDELLDDPASAYQGIPWVNTIAADSKRQGLYADIGSVPNVTDAKATALQHGARRTRRFAAARPAVLDGSRSACEWGTDPDAVAARDLRALATCRACSATTTSTNSNDSYWLVQPRAAARGLRADHRRRAHRALAAHAARADDGRASGWRQRRLLGQPFTLQQRGWFDNRQYAASCGATTLVAICQRERRRWPARAGRST